VKAIDGRIFVIDNALSVELCTGLASRCERLAQDVGLLRKGAASRGGTSEYTVIDGFTVDAAFPELLAWYYSAKIIGELIWPDKMVLSPYKQSSINTKVYHSDNCSHGWHTDTNPVTALLYLTDNEGGTHFCLSETKTEVVPAIAGRMLLFFGRNMVHGVPSARAGRVVVTANLYLEHDCHRPKWIDQLEYSNAPPPPIEEL